MREEEKTKLSGIMLAGVIVIALFVYTVETQPIVTGDLSRSTYELMTFSSYNELLEFLKDKYENLSRYHGFYLNPQEMLLSKGSSIVLDLSEGSNSIDFSKTNIQVDGVDEPDIVKTDGTYLYILENNDIYIIKAFPVDDAAILSKISVNDNISLSNIFINNDRLIVFGVSWGYPVEYQDEYKGFSNCWRGISSTMIRIYNVEDRENPELVESINMDGRYFDSRMIGDYVYVVSTESVYDIYHICNGNESINIPELTVDDKTITIPADQMFYIDTPEQIDMMTHILSINIFNGKINQKSFMLGNSQILYVSKNNVYLTCIYRDYIPSSSPINTYYDRIEEKTIIHKISIDVGNISYASQGEVPGHVLNQFSMDEYNGYFRIATTVGHVSGWGDHSTNNVYILDEDLNVTGEIENLAHGERIYSARFMGNRGYIVTFKKIDPLFVLDLKDPKNPMILGELNIPGYSDYLHPFDEDHIIGIGKDTVEPQEDIPWTKDFAWYQGIKIAIFDVSDVENPIELHKETIGDRGTDSLALHDHKAFLFDREKELLVIPIDLYEISDEIKEQNNGYTGSIYGEFKFQGAYIYKLTLENGFEYKGRITHMDENNILESYSRYYDLGSTEISRTLYIDNVLYTISSSAVKMNNLNDLSEINIIYLQ